MSGKMLAATEVLESLSHASYTQRREEAAARRISRRAVLAALQGKEHYEVRGGLLGLFSTTHSPDVYAEVADRAWEEGVAIQVHRYVKTVPVRIPESYQTFNTERQYDSIAIIAVKGSVEPAADQQIPTGRYVESLYPPPQDIDGLHNL
jgi:hypothetical protein